jgi:hypothetical protein
VYGDAWLRPTREVRTDAELPPTPPPAAPGRRRRSARRPWFLAGVGAALVLASAGAFSSGARGGDARVSSVTYPVTARTVTIRGGADDIEVHAGPRGGTLSVRTEARCWGDASHAAPSWSGNTLALDGGCGGFPGWGSVDHVVEVPDGTAVVIDNGSGDLTLTGGLGATTARSGSGDIEVRDVPGALDVETGSGDIDATGLGQAAVTARSGSGDVDLELSSAADTVEVRTGSGDASVRLPPGAYAVSTETGSGDEEVEVTQSSASRDHLTVRTGSGDIDVRYR